MCCWFDSRCVFLSSVLNGLKECYEQALRRDDVKAIVVTGMQSYLNLYEQAFWARGFLILSLSSIDYSEAEYILQFDWNRWILWTFKLWVALEQSWSDRKWKSNRRFCGIEKNILFLLVIYTTSQVSAQFFVTVPGAKGRFSGGFDISAFGGIQDGSCT